MKILFITARLPYPPLKGDQVRGYHHLRLLSTRHQLSLVSLADSQPSDRALEALAPYVDELTVVPISRQKKLFNLVGGGLTSLPLQTAVHQVSDMSRVIRSKLASGRYDLAYVQLARMAPYLIDERSIPRVIDLIDALSLNMKRRFERERGPSKWIFYLEWRRMARYERLICERYDRATVVSKLDKMCIGSYENLSINPNGVDLDYFQYVSPAVREESRNIVFVGNMGYFPNINAVEWFVSNVFPRVKQRFADVSFTIVGPNPPPRLRHLEDLDIRVMGFVEDIRVYLTKAILAVVPLRAGSGMQFKVIEAMTTGTPLVVTPYALGGIDVVDGRHLLVADEPQEFADKVIKLIADKDLQEHLSRNARKLVEENFSWERCVSDLELIFEDLIRARQTA